MDLVPVCWPRWKDGPGLFVAESLQLDSAWEPAFCYDSVWMLGGWGFG